MTSRRTFLRNSGLVLGAAALPAAAQTTSPQKTVLLHCGWATKNIGDIGHTPGTLRFLEQYLPGAKVILWAANTNEAVDAMLMKRFPKLEIVKGSLSKEDGAVADAIKRSDFFLRGPGMGQPTDFMKYCDKAGKPWGLQAQSYFPDMVTGKGAEERIALLNSAAFIYCRDSKTLKLLQDTGVKPPVLEWAPDGCFGIDVRDEEKALARLKKHGLEEKKFITIQLRTHSPTSPGVDDKRPQKLNPLHPTPENIADDTRRAKVYQDLIAMWVKETGWKVVIAPEVYKEMEYNKKFIYDTLPDDLKKHVVNFDEFWNVDEACSFYARAHTVICHEPHTPIMALAMGTPIIHTFSEFHSPKCWMFKDIGLEEWAPEFDATPASKMFEILMGIHKDYPAAQAKVKKAMAYVEERAQSQMKVLKGVIKA
ncbi:polysaccharide pyruvyl transferase WcaK-like protein [Roseimicrobium gellanilyticum]|uniref:Polysaccharide pyruvyl transferase WcaK-like protein n=1 Tax=Roseimicrobium gellanilyticum TaxID=748857 RepID=A0A366HS51_9BACT|nr:polysaccharide pyruvyl transferase family protein [Roseimicrobium gellanilyticum]RBP46510.1 polysaccharide pyruvyl transferase WcaK-like protein [Roseimicrobium gellanilyticum]